MKLSWKLFFTTMLISAVCIVVSGYSIIHANLRSQLDREVKVSQDYAEVVYYALSSEIYNVQRLSSSDITHSKIADTLSQVAYSVSVDMMSQKVLFGVLDESGKELFTSLPASLDKSMLNSLRADTAGWTIKQNGASYYLQTLRPALYEDTLFYIEILRDVSQIYQNQETQYETLIVMLVGMIFVVGILTFLITKKLLRQVMELTTITKAIADGNLNKRAIPKGQDEIALLADNFNRMADHLEGKIEELKAEAERKELFVGAFSHELKTPLTSIIGFADLLRRKELDSKQRHICAEYIFTEGKRLETLSMRLLDLIVLQKHTLLKTTVDISLVFGEVLAVVKPQLLASHISLQYQIEPALLSMEAELMKTVFLNLLDNARKAITDQGQILILGRKKSRGYVLCIRDSGRGMNPEDLTKITEAFYMTDISRSRSQGGAGLGLAICDEILKLHGFTLSFKSQLGIGTTAILTMKEDCL